MKLIAVYITILNLGTCALTFCMMQITGEYRSVPIFDKGVARIAAGERLNQLSSLASAPVVRVHSSCVDEEGRAGMITGSGDTERQSRVIDGVPVIDSAKFSFRANVHNRCQAYNPNCYKVEKLLVDASRTIEPRL
jgi:hypothetical protein